MLKKTALFLRDGFPNVDDYDAVDKDENNDIDKDNSSADVVDYGKL